MREQRQRNRFRKPCYSKSNTVAGVPVEEHMANYQAARALRGKGRDVGEGAAGLSKRSAKKSAIKKANPKN